MTFPPGPASDEEDPPGWDVRGDEPQATSAVWQAVGSVGGRAHGGGADAARGRTEPLAAVRVPTADPVHSTGPEPRAVDSPRPAVEDPATELSGPPAELAAPPADPAIPAGYPQPPPAPHRGRSWAAMLALLAIGLCGLAGGAAGAVRQLLPREFSVAQQGQIQNWQMTRRWRAQQAGQVFPASLQYQIPNTSLNSRTTSRSRPPAGHRGAEQLRQGRVEVGRGGARGRPVRRVLRATYLDASESMVATVGVAALPTHAAALAAVGRLPAVHNQSFALHAFALARSAAASFRQAQRQLSVADRGRALRHPRDGGIHRRPAARAAVIRRLHPAGDEQPRLRVGR